MRNIMKAVLYLVIAYAIALLLNKGLGLEGRALIGVATIISVIISIIITVVKDRKGGG